jgi:hypothetical protein
LEHSSVAAVEEPNVQAPVVLEALLPPAVARVVGVLPEPQEPPTLVVEVVHPVVPTTEQMVVPALSYSAWHCRAKQFRSLQLRLPV